MYKCAQLARDLITNTKTIPKIIYYAQAQQMAVETQAGWQHKVAIHHQPTKVDYDKLTSHCYTLVSYYHPPTKLREGNVFSRVCLSFCSQGVGGPHVTTTHNTQTLPTVIKFELLVVGMLNHLTHTPTHLHAHLCPCAQYTAQVGARVWVGLHAHPLALLGGVVGRIEGGWYVIMAACAHSHPFVPTCINSGSRTPPVTLQLAI